MSVVAEPAARTPRGEVLERADGVELIGEYEGSGFRRPPLLARRGDGQVVQLTWLLYLVAGACDGRRDAQEVADAVSERYGRRVSARNVLHVAQEQLRPAGVLALADGTTPELPTRRALLALRHRRPFASARVVGVAAGALTWLHRPLVQLPVLLTLALFDVWLFGIHGIAASLLSVVYEPGLLLFVLGLVVAATLLHELGHASACRYGGARPGVMGIGLYLVWPAFYCDVTDAYRLNRAGRLRTDLGGVYFNGIFALLAGGAYFVTGVEALLLAAFLQHTIVLQQLLPLLRFDGYYVLSDLTGVPDILSRIKPIFRSLIPGRREPKVDELKPWVRVVVTAYLLVLAPMLVLLVAWIVVGAPRLLATTYDSLGVQLDRLRDAAGPAELGVGALRIAALLMPVAGTGLSVARSGKMATRGLVGWARGSVARSIVAVGLMGAAALFACSAWWPDRDYRPIQPGERGTIGEAVTSLPKVAERVPPLAADVPTSAEPDTVTPEIGRRQGSRRHSWTGRHASGRTSPEPAVGDGVPDARLKPPESAWDDGDLYPVQDDEPSSDVGDVSPPASSATPTPAPATDQTTTEPGATPTPTPTETGTPTPTPTPTETATPTPMPTETATPTPTETPVGTADPSPTASAQAEVPDATPSPTPTP